MVEENIILENLQGLLEQIKVFIGRLISPSILVTICICYFNKKHLKW